MSEPRIWAKESLEKIPIYIVIRESDIFRGLPPDEADMDREKKRIEDSIHDAELHGKSKEDLFKSVMSECDYLAANMDDPKSDVYIPKSEIKLAPWTQESVAFIKDKYKAMLEA